MKALGPDPGMNAIKIEQLCVQHISYCQGLLSFAVLILKKTVSASFTEETI